MKKEKYQLLHKEKNHPVIVNPRTFGEKAADMLTNIIGSWTFILLFVIFLFFWISLNTIWLTIGQAWDKKPFIMLNLILSCLAALQAPIILMKQNRQTQKYHLQAEYDYAVNRKAEHEIEQIKQQLDRIEKRLR